MRRMIASRLASNVLHATPKRMTPFRITLPDEAASEVTYRCEMALRGEGGGGLDTMMLFPVRHASIDFSVLTQRGVTQATGEIFL